MWVCGNEKIRYVHVMEHPDPDKSCEVECVCAEEMNNDYGEPKRREANWVIVQPGALAGCTANGGAPRRGRFLKHVGYNRVV